MDILKGVTVTYVAEKWSAKDGFPILYLLVMFIMLLGLCLYTWNARDMMSYLSMTADFHVHANAKFEKIQKDGLIITMSCST